MSRNPVPPCLLFAILFFLVGEPQSKSRFRGKSNQKTYPVFHSRTLAIVKPPSSETDTDDVRDEDENEDADDVEIDLKRSGSLETDGKRGELWVLC